MLSLYDTFVKSDEKLRYIIYGDTDSFFVNLFDLYCKRFDISPEDLKSLLILDLNGVNNQKIEEVYNNIKKLASEIKAYSSDYMVNYLRNKMNCLRDNTIDFEFEYLASFFRTIAKKTYVYKQTLKNGIKKKNFGVKRSDPILTKESLDIIVKNLFLYNTTDKFIFSIIEIIKEYIKKLDNFDKDCGIPTSISSNLTGYKVFTIQLKSLIAYAACKHIIKSKDNYMLPSLSGIEYKGFRFTVNPTPELIKYTEVAKAIFDNFATQNSVVKFSKDALTNLFIPDVIYFSGNSTDNINAIKKYFKPNYYDMIDSSIYSYLKRLAGITFTDKFHEYILSTDSYDMNIIKKYIVYTQSIEQE